MNIYAINYGVGQYAITENQIRDSLGDLNERAHISVSAFDQLNHEALGAAEFLVAPRFDTEVIRKHAPNLRLAHCINAGVERFMPLDWLPRGAIFSNSSGIHAVKAREYALMSILMLNSRMPQFAYDQSQRRWQPIFTSPVADKKLLVVGTGGIGTAVALAGGTLGLSVTGVSRSGRPAEGFNRVVPQDALDDVLPDADFVVLACPLTPETQNLISARRISSLKPGAGIVNMARGAVVDYNAITDALNRNALAGCVADVFEVEPLASESTLWDVPRFVVTPHISCDAPTGYVEAGLRLFAKNVRALTLGEPVANVVNPELGY
ncbi:D-2-hydroxyacid dehydrogenase [Paraburkholderia sp. BR13439]|uniref:D-2-hydroxyacid dehydrogenase n=1 Tax=unclassified Paraburkholderia TaxID=2615204 RepID=UPI0034CF829E